MIVQALPSFGLSFAVQTSKQIIAYLTSCSFIKFCKALRVKSKTLRSSLEYATTSLSYTSLWIGSDRDVVVVSVQSFHAQSILSDERLCQYLLATTNGSQSLSLDAFSMLSVP